MADDLGRAPYGLWLTTCHSATMEVVRSTTFSAKAQVQALFDSLALEYVQERDRQLSFLSQKAIAIDFLGGAKGRLLEVGCGPAVMTPDLLAMGLESHGIDVSSEMVRRARQRMAGHPLEQHCTFAVDDVERLHFSEGSFDAVLCMGVLEYLPRYTRALAEISRVLKPGGVAVIALPNRASAYHVVRDGYRALRKLERRLRGRREPHSLAHNRCVPWTFDRELARAGLAKEASRSCNFIFYPVNELMPRITDSLNRSLLRFSGAWFAPLIGAQYIVKAKKLA